MLLDEFETEIPAVAGHTDLLAYLAEAVPRRLEPDLTPVRFVITESASGRYRCEIGAIRWVDDGERPRPPSIFELVPRKTERTEAFNAVLIVPTGIGAEIGGHAGDAAPVARLLATVCDNLITHPNVVNASDINEIPENGLYVEGSVLCRLLLGSAGLQKVRSNRVLVVTDEHLEEAITIASVNAVGGARASYGLRCPAVVRMDPPVSMQARYSASGRSAGQVGGLERLCEVLDEYRDQYDAVAVSSVIGVPQSFHMDYFTSKGEVVNPWGGVEAMLTHAISCLYDVPSAHSPMLESSAITYLNPGIVDPRMAAEMVSVTFLQSVLKGLHRAPRIVADPDAVGHSGVLTAADVSCVVIPEGCLGLPTLAALEQDIPVIAVRENHNLMRNDLAKLPWAPDQLHVVDNYWEALGVMAAMKAGIAPDSTRRPLADTTLEQHTWPSAEAPASADVQGGRG